MFKFSKIQILSLILCISFSFVSCKEKKKAQPTTNHTTQNDKIFGDDFVVDKTKKDYSGAPMPQKLDESFDDFVFTYAANEEFQIQRTKFPLLMINEETSDSIYVDRSSWKLDTIFTDRNFYTILYDKEDDMDIVNQPDLVKAQVEWVNLENKETKFYHFLKDNGCWMLNDISFNHFKEYRNEAFLSFYQKFAVDSVYQSSRLADTLEYVTSDPNDDFEILETSISHSDWLRLNPLLPSSKLVNINYGQVNDIDSPIKILAVKGISNGFSNVFFFRLNDQKKWELFKFDDVGI